MPDCTLLSLKMGCFLAHLSKASKMPDCTFLSLKVGCFLKCLRQDSTNARLYTFESQSGVNSCTFEVGFNKCQMGTPTRGAYF